MRRGVHYFGIAAVILLLFVIDGGAVVRGITLRIDNDRDAQGCFRPAAYTWDEGIGACAETGEGTQASQGSRRAAQLAVTHVGSSWGLTVTHILPVPCDRGGCFHVVLERPVGRRAVEQRDVQVRGWTVMPKDVPPRDANQLCAAHAGEVWCDVTHQCVLWWGAACPFALP